MSVLKFKRKTKLVGSIYSIVNRYGNCSPQKAFSFYTRCLECSHKQVFNVNRFCNASKIYSVYVAFHDRSHSVCGGFTLRLGYTALRHVTVSMAMRARRLHVITRVVVSGRRTVRASVRRETSADVIVYSRTSSQRLDGSSIQARKFLAS